MSDQSLATPANAQELRDIVIHDKQLSPGSSNSDEIDVNRTKDVPSPVDDGTAIDKDKTVDGDKDEKKEAVQRVSLGALFRFADSYDIALICIGSLGAIANGAIMPAFSIIFGHLINSFNNLSDIANGITFYATIFVYIGIGAWVSSALEITCWKIAGERQTLVLRREYMTAVLSHEQTWHDEHTGGEILNGLSSDTRIFQEGISEKVGLAIRFYSTFISGLVIGFVFSWQFSLVILACTPLLVAALMMMGKVLKSTTESSQTSYSSAGQIAMESISNIKTVMAFSMQFKLLQQYNILLSDAQRAGNKAALAKGLGTGFTMLVIYSVYGLAMWYGSTLVAQGVYNGGTITTTLFAVMTGAFGLGQAAPAIPAILSARASSYKLYGIIDRVSKINALSSTPARTLQPVNGEWRFDDVDFKYATRSEQTILNKLTLTISPGQTVALVGSSGGGKSTVVSLLQRLYDANSGTVSLDGVDVTTLNVHWLREQLSVVQQEPILFHCSVLDNIRYGNPDATMDQVVTAAQAASADEFIQSFPLKYDTLVGERGSEISGGQRQRIALARAFVRKPKLLLLDESTSALDARTEARVQSAISEYLATHSCSALIVAHRLSSIRNADKILVMSAGRVVETGTHDELMSQNGVYYNLVAAQAHAADSTGLSPPLTSHSPEPVAAEQLDVEIMTPTVHKIDIDQPAKVQTSNGSSDSSKADDDKTARVRDAPVRRVFGYISDQWPWVVLAVFSTLCIGGSFPAFSQLLSNIITIFYKPVNQISSTAALLAGLFAVVGAALFFAHLGQEYAFGVTGEKLTQKLRIMSMTKILSMNQSWFHQEQNSSGLLCARLADDASKVKGLTNGPIQQGVQLIALIIAGLTIAFVYQPALAGVLLSVAPLLAGANYLQMQFIHGFTDQSKAAVERASAVAQESVTQLRTVTAFNAQQTVLKSFLAVLAENKRVGYKSAFITGMGFGSSQFILFATYCLGFWFGGQLVGQGKATFSDIINAFFAIMFSAMGIGQASSFAPDYKKASAAAVAICKLLDEESFIDPNSMTEQPATHTSTDSTPSNQHATVQINNIHFAYPSRPDAPVFDDLSLTIPAGKTLAVVGTSGSGKSTLLSLLLRFYDVSAGSITMDGVDIQMPDVQAYRSAIGYVQQEPSLFTATIRENILYGEPNAIDEEMYAAARGANIHDFIMTLEKGYDTPVSQSALSGGQKQRICIARCLILKPRLLLFDEATSALDAASEKLVEETIKEVSKTCTTIIVAHRLSTIRSADMIAVVDAGKIVELGGHDELVKKRGTYYHLVQASVT